MGNHLCPWWLKKTSEQNSGGFPNDRGSIMRRNNSLNKQSCHQCLWSNHRASFKWLPRVSHLSRLSTGSLFLAEKPFNCVFIPTHNSTLWACFHKIAHLRWVEEKTGLELYWFNEQASGQDQANIFKTSVRSCLWKGVCVCVSTRDNIPLPHMQVCTYCKLDYVSREDANHSNQAFHISLELPYVTLENTGMRRQP